VFCIGYDLFVLGSIIGPDFFFVGMWKELKS
jgi:hypothetical protein